MHDTLKQNNILKQSGKK